MALQVGSVSLEMIAALRPLVPRIRRQDKALADQLLRAASSVALNIAEATYSDPGTNRSRFFSAAGSANETLTVLHVATAWGYFTHEDTCAADALCRRVLAMLWRLTHG
ncbi:MAG TPA: four helix bundle protein [Polyangiaceae bacterium]|jgi:four helix bundle protein|nr:four helix bundle protein [Polyangiaceae bacterium]